jgi:3-oxoacyl-[acyl-carrier-protein] synthase II
MAACGALEIAASLLAFERDTLAPTYGHDLLDPDIDLDVIGREPRRCAVEYLLKSSFGFGGQNAAIVLGRV